LTQIVLLGCVVAISVLKDGKRRNRRFQSLPSPENFFIFSGDSVWNG